MAKNTKQVGLVDHETGESLADIAFLIPATRQKNLFGRGKRWAVVFQDSMQELAASSLSKTALRVIILFLSIMEFDNFVKADQAAIAKALDTNQGNISRAMKELASLGIITTGKGRFKTSMKFNPEFAYKGDWKQHAEQTKKKPIKETITNFENERKNEGSSEKKDSGNTNENEQFGDES